MCRSGKTIGRPLGRRRCTVHAGAYVCATGGEAGRTARAYFCHLRSGICESEKHINELSHEPPGYRTGSLRVACDYIYMKGSFHLSNLIKVILKTCFQT